MLLIVVEHVIGHGMGLLDYINNPQSNTEHVPFLVWLIYSPCVMAVNCFVFISGYYGICLTVRRILNLMIQALTTSIMVLIMGYLFGVLPSIKIIFQSLSPITCSYWWFLSDYVMLMLLSPMLNEFVSEKISKHIQLFILIFLFIILYIGGLLFNTVESNLGYSMPCFIFIYLLGRFISKENIFIRNMGVLYFFIFFASSVLLSILSFYFQNCGTAVLKRLFAYNNPLVLLSAISFFFLFQAFKIKISLRSVSCLTFGVYLFHDNPIARSALPLWYNLLGGVLVIVLFFGTLILEYIRQKFVKLTRLDKVVYNFFNLKNNE